MIKEYIVANQSNFPLSPSNNIVIQGVGNNSLVLPESLKIGEYISIYSNNEGLTYLQGSSNQIIEWLDHSGDLQSISADIGINFDEGSQFMILYCGIREKDKKQLFILKDAVGNISVNLPAASKSQSF